ncbi:MAG TPA: peptide chain release factor N(5)-glutamine methyltransferase [Candidatus Paceibacterota bacterium]|nr:peptide chain release factor N(5)-glutamine methyltransferase [Candidatus Paceibacterota bacterium]
MQDIPANDIRQLIRDKYGSLDRAREGALEEDRARLASGEPLAYVIGWVPFLGLRIDLSSRPLIPRPETEWWTSELLHDLGMRYGTRRFRLLDLCAGSGAIGLSVLAKFPNAEVAFGELEPAHTAAIKDSIALNNLDASRASVACGDLFAPFAEERFDVIATNPPYVPDGRALEPSVTDYEPASALYAGADGLSLIRRIAAEAPRHLAPAGVLWMECDIENIAEAQDLLPEGGAASAEIRNDQYGRPRVVVGYYP